MESLRRFSVDEWPVQPYGRSPMFFASSEGGATGGAFGAPFDMVGPESAAVSLGQRAQTHYQP